VGVEPEHPAYLDDLVECRDGGLEGLLNLVWDAGNQKDACGAAAS
jgi:hypothetical protein